MTRDEIIELVNQLTERKAENVISLPSLYQHVCQEFCAEFRFWWRKKSFSFNTVASQANYDLNTLAGLTDIEVEEITKVLWVSAANGVVELDPIFDDQSIVEEIEFAAINAGLGAPNTYTFDFTDWKTMRIQPVSDQPYKIRVVAWCTASPATDSTSQVVPLIPPRFHRGVVHGMEKYVWRVIYGQEDPRTATAELQYQKVVQQAQMRPRFTTNYTSQLISSEDSVQSTNNGRTANFKSSSGW